MFFFATFSTGDFGWGRSGFLGWLRTEAARVLESGILVFGVEVGGRAAGLLRGVAGLVMVV